MITMGTQILVKTSKKYGWFPSLIFSVHLYIFLLTELYTTHPQIDVLLHFFGGVSSAYFWQGFLFTVAHLKLIRHPSLLNQQVIVLFATLLTAIVWEVYEYVSDTYVGTVLQLGWLDTFGDLFWHRWGTMLQYGFEVFSQQRTP